MSASSSDLQDMVTDLIGRGEDASKEQTSLIERLQQDPWPEHEIIISEGRKLEKFLATARAGRDSTEIRDRTAEWAGLLIGEPYIPKDRVGWKPLLRDEPGYGEAFLRLHDYLRQPNKNNLRLLHDFVRGFTNSLECQEAKGYYRYALDFLQERWEDDTASNLAALTGTSKPTAKRWLGGSCPSHENHTAISRMVETIYSLEVDCRLGPEGAEKWLRSDNTILEATPWEYILQNSWWPSNQKWQEAMEDLFAKNN